MILLLSTNEGFISAEEAQIVRLIPSALEAGTYHCHFQDGSIQQIDFYPVFTNSDRIQSWTLQLMLILIRNN